PDGWQQGTKGAPGGQVAPMADAKLSPWWPALQDPHLNQLIEQALARNNNLAQAAIKVRRAQLVAGQAVSDRLPSFSVRGSTNATQPLDGAATTRSHGVSASASWEVDLWNRLGS